MQTKKYTKKDFNWVNVKRGDASKILNNAIEELECDIKNIKEIKDFDRTFENTIEAFENMGNRGSQEMSYLGFLMNVHTDKKIVEEIHRSVEEYTNKTLELIYDDGLYKALVEYSNKKEKLSGEKKILFEENLKAFKRMGFGLTKGAREKLKKNRQKLSRLALSFENNLNKYQDSIILKKEDAFGIPDNILNRFSKDKNGDYVVTLDYPDIGPFLEYSPNDFKRKELSDKNNKKGGEENLKLIKEIVKLRGENARLLGYKTHAHYVIEERMAKTPENVFKFVNPLLKKLQKIYEEDNKRVLDIKSEIKGKKQKEITYYDGYYKAELLRRTLGFSSEELRPYLSLENVLGSLFSIYSKLFGISFKESKDIPTWHKDVKVFEVIDNKSRDVRALIFMDLFPRENKYKHAAAYDIVVGHVNKEKNGEVYIPPVSSIVANFTKPGQKKHSLLTHNEVEVLFHEFGHIMHQTLTRAKYASQAGSNTAWDFVEAPSQMFENWVWDKKILQSMMKHYETGELIPEGLLNNLLKSRSFLSASMYLRSIVFVLYDLKIHMDTKADLVKSYSGLVKKIMKYSLPKDQMFIAGFGHMAGGYDAGYYSYLWSEVYAFDLFSRFAGKNILNSKVGRDYRREILEVGSSRKEADSIRSFLGRKPNNKAFLRMMFGR
jgi:thimet oligopeptidase